VTGSVSSSLRQGIWMMSFIGREGQYRQGAWRARRSPGIGRDQG
jgi:hypothetical protein